MQGDIVGIIRGWAEGNDDQDSEFYVPFDQRTIPIEHALAAANEIDCLREKEQDFVVSNYGGYFFALLFSGVCWAAIIAAGISIYRALT